MKSKLLFVFIIILLSFLYISVSAGPLQRSHLEVISAKSVAVGGSSGIIGTSLIDSTTKSATSGYTYYSQFTATQAGELGYAHIYIDTGNTGSVCISLHDASTGASLASGSSSVSGISGQWVNFALDSPYTIGSGDYLVAVTVSVSNIIVERANNNVDVLYFNAISCTDTFSLPGTSGWSIDSISVILNNTSGDPV